MDKINLNTLLMAVALGVLGWIGLSTHQTSVKVAAIETKLDTNAIRDADHEARLRALESRAINSSRD